MVREYIGGGVLGRLAAQLDEIERRQREEETADGLLEGGAGTLRAERSLRRRARGGGRDPQPGTSDRRWLSYTTRRMEEASTWIWRLGCRMTSRIG